MDLVKKSQVFFNDFILALLIFIFIFIIYFSYTKNLVNRDSGELGDLISELKTISLSFVQEGYPDSWNTVDVVRIGFTDKWNRIDNTQFKRFIGIGYNKSKKLLGTTHDYLLFFLNESNGVQNVEGICGYGSVIVNISYDLSSAYYYQAGSQSEENLKSFMKNEFSADIFCEKSTDCPGETGDFDAFIASIHNYDFIVVEQPYWSGGGAGSPFGQFETAADSWLQNGGILFVGGEIPSANQIEAFGVEFNKIAGASEKFGLATVINKDPFTAFDVGDNIIFTQEYYVINKTIDDGFIDIARFNGTWVEFDDIKKNGDISIARWPFGDGKIFFFSDFDANYLAGDFQEILKASARKWANARCQPINISNIVSNRFVKNERLLIYDSKIVKMVIYLWE